MSSRNEQFLSFWQKKRAKGKWHFVFREGLVWAIITGLLFRLTYWIGLLGEAQEFSQAFMSMEALTYYLAFILGGIPYGWTMWNMYERKYRKLDQ